MLKTELIKHLQSNIVKYGDGEIRVEVIAGTESSGSVYKIVDVTNMVGYDLKGDYITCSIEK